MNLVRDVAEKEAKILKEVNMEVVHDEENAVESVVEIEAVETKTSAVHLMKGTEIETLRGIQTSIDLKVGVVVQLRSLINMATNHHLLLGEIVP